MGKGGAIIKSFIFWYEPKARNTGHWAAGNIVLIDAIDIIDIIDAIGQ